MKNFNRRRYVLNKKVLLNILLLIIITIIITIVYFEKKNISILIKNTIQSFSQNFAYEYVTFNINGLEKIEKNYIEKKLKKYLKTSIFLLPLDEISNSIKENNWIKKIKLSTNYKDTLFINIEEYKPLGIYNFNNKLFFFDVNGKIIDHYDTSKKFNDSFIEFKGQSSNLEAKVLIDILNNLKFQKKYKIKNAELINKRRWDILLTNDTLLMLSEDDPRNSLENFLKIINNLSETDLNDIKSFDLRNIKKTLLIKND